MRRINHTITNSNGSPNIVLQQTAIADYRQEVFNQLQRHWGSALTVVVGDVYFDATTRTRIDMEGNLRYVSNRFLFGRRLLWQRNTVKSMVSADVTIAELNPRILSVWLAVLIRRILCRHTVLWGHAWPRKGQTSPTERVRGWLRRLANVILVYTETQRDELLISEPATSVICAPNAIYRSDQMTALSVNSPNDILCVGRLVASKKPILLLEAFEIAVRKGLPPSHRLIFAGEGPERAGIEAGLSKMPELVGRVVVLGHVPPTEMPALYQAAFVSVAPGTVGLSITQSLSFGVPMIIAREEPHGPEIEAASDGVNSLFVGSDDAESIAEALLQIARERRIWSTRRTAIVLDCAARYSVEQMVDGIIVAVEGGVDTSDIPA